MTNFAEKFDGSGREVRPHQHKAFNFIEETWAEPTVALQAGTGVGKSGIGVALIKQVGGIYCVPSNQLMDQLIRDYPEVNYLKGVAHYECMTEPGLTCADAKEIHGTTCNLACPYQEAVWRCLNGEPTFVNPASFVFLKHRQGYRPPNVLVVDECHTLISSLMLMSGTVLSQRKYGTPDEHTTTYITTWLKEIIRELQREYDALPRERYEARCKLAERIDRLSLVAHTLYSSPQYFTIYEEDGDTHIKPIQPPKEMVDSFFNVPKTVLMSATLNEFAVEELLQHNKFVFTELGTPIPPANRRILAKPAPFKMNWQTEPSRIARWIKTQMKKYPDRNTIVHLTYSDVEKLKGFFPDCIANTKETKTACIEEFKEKGGLFLAAACAEGVDLPYDECRLNIIPRLNKPNLHDPVVKKRRALSDGQVWYTLQVMDTTIQQVGRSTRAVDDKSISIIGDNNFKWMLNSVKDKVNHDFREAIVWK